MPKGKPWTRAQEKKLQDLVKAKVSSEAIARELGMTVDAVSHKMRRLGLEEVGKDDLHLPSSSDLPKDLFTVEQVLLSQGCRVYQLKKKIVFFIMRLNRKSMGLYGLFSIVLLKLGLEWRNYASSSYIVS